MAVTSVTVPWKDGTKRNLQFITQQFPTGLFVGVQICNEDWKPFGEPAETTDIRSEEEYHKSLRAEAHAKGQFVAQYSTNPEWHPGYVEPKEEEDAAV